MCYILLEESTFVPSHVRKEKIGSYLHQGTPAAASNLLLGFLATGGGVGGCHAMRTSWEQRRGKRVALFLGDDRRPYVTPAECYPASRRVSASVEPHTSVAAPPGPLTHPAFVLDPVRPSLRRIARNPAICRIRPSVSAGPPHANRDARDMSITVSVSTAPACRMSDKVIVM